jgi:hypothetical protein
MLPGARNPDGVHLLNAAVGARYLDRSSGAEPPGSAMVLGRLAQARTSLIWLVARLQSNI